MLRLFLMSQWRVPVLPVFTITPLPIPEQEALSKKLSYLCKHLCIDVYKFLDAWCITNYP
ncbi:hypothetical protein DMR31_23190, partial [Klebsiella variicola]